MKRHHLTVTVLASASGVTAYSSDNKETTATPAAMAVQTETEKSAKAEGDMELEYFYDFVGEVADKMVTAKDDAGREVKFDVSEVEIEDTDVIGEGDETEVTHTGELSSDTIKVKSADAVISAAAETAEETVVEEDAIVTETIEKVDDNTLTLAMDEGTYTLDIKIAQKVSKDSVKSGVQADVTYYGDLEDDADKPATTKIVTGDTMGSEDAKTNTPSGKVAEVGTGYAVIDTVDLENALFIFLGKEDMSDKLRIEGTATIIYKGILTDRTITATNVK